MPFRLSNVGLSWFKPHSPPAKAVTPRFTSGRAKVSYLRNNVKIQDQPQPTTMRAPIYSRNYRLTGRTPTRDSIKALKEAMKSLFNTSWMLCNDLRSPHESL